MSLHLRIPAFVVDDEGNEQPVDLFVDVGSFSMSGPELSAELYPEDTDVLSFTTTVKPPFKPYKEWQERQYHSVLKKETP